MSNNYALITGASSGIGLEIAKCLAEKKYNVILTARSEKKLIQFSSEISQNYGVKSDYIKCDLSEKDAPKMLYDFCESNDYQINILINNAGGAGDLQPTISLSDESFDECMKWNVYSTFWGTRRALKYMTEQSWGRIINISSMEGKHGKPVLTAYTTAKHAINGMTKSVAREVGTQGITVNAICPGLVITDIVRDNGPNTAEAMGMTFDEMVDLFSKEAAIERPNTVEEVAAVAVLLASDLGGGITGALMSVDGGTAQY